LTERTWALTPLRVDFQSGDTFKVMINPTYEVLDLDFRVGGGIVLPKGTAYNYTRYSVSLQTARQRVISTSHTFAVGTF
jgi:hypothetical protein